MTVSSFTTVQHSHANVVVVVVVGAGHALQSPNNVTVIDSPGACPGVEFEQTNIVPDGGIVGIGFALQSNPIGVAGDIAELFVIS